MNTKDYTTLHLDTNYSKGTTISLLLELTQDDINKLTIHTILVVNFNSEYQDIYLQIYKKLQHIKHFCNNSNHINYIKISTFVKTSINYSTPLRTYTDVGYHV